MADEHFMLIPNTRVCPGCGGVFQAGMECLHGYWYPGKLQDDRGDRRLDELRSRCRSCGHIHLSIPGMTTPHCICPDTTTTEEVMDSDDASL
jgi:ribosomal protein L32